MSQQSFSVLSVPRRRADEAVQVVRPVLTRVAPVHFADSAAAVVVAAGVTRDRSQSREQSPAVSAARVALMEGCGKRRRRSHSHAEKECPQQDRHLLFLNISLSLEMVLTRARVVSRLDSRRSLPPLPPCGASPLRDSKAS